MPFDVNGKGYRKHLRKIKAEQAASRVTIKGPPSSDWGDVKEEPISPEEAWAKDQAASAEPEPKNAEELKKKLELERAKEIKERVDLELMGWPWDKIPQKLFTTAPFSLNTIHGNPYRRPEMPQFSPILAFLLRNEDICEQILHQVFTSYYDACSLVSASRFTWWLVNEYMGKWNMTEGFFSDCDVDSAVLAARGHPEPAVPGVLIVSPVRSMISKRIPVYDIEIDNLYRMCKAMGTYSDNFRNLQLHRIPFLTHELLLILIPKMRNLRNLGIFNCPLINISHTLKLLDMIKTDKPKERENQIMLDFFPAHHVGPVNIPNLQNYTGNYGVTWDNFGVGDTRLAIWQLMTQILPRAVKQEIDFVGKHTMFRKWLDMSPCVEVETCLKAIMDPKMQPEKFAAVMDWFHYQGDAGKLINNIANRPEGYQWLIQFYRCGHCYQKVQGVFFYYDEIRVARNEGRLNSRHPVIRCLGCMLGDYLARESDHFKNKKRFLMRKWIYDGKEANTADIPKLLSDFEEKEIHRYAMQLNEIRHKSARTYKYDKEIEDRQRPHGARELGRHGAKYISPTFEDKLLFEKFQKMTPEEKEWSGICTDRLFGHGHGGLD